MSKKQTRRAILADLDRELTVVDSIKEVSAPSGKTLAGAVPLLQVLGLPIDGHRRALQQIRRDLSAAI